MGRLLLPRGTVRHPAQLLDELLTAHPAWRGAQQADGSWRDPLIHLEHTPTELRITVPDGEEALVQTVVQAHIPGPTAQEKKAQVRARLAAAIQKKLLLTDDELHAVMGG